MYLLCSYTTHFKNHGILKFGPSTDIRTENRGNTEKRKTVIQLESWIQLVYQLINVIDESAMTRYYHFNYSKSNGHIELDKYLLISMLFRRFSVLISIWLDFNSTFFWFYFTLLRPYLDLIWALFDLISTVLPSLHPVRRAFHS